MKKIIIAIVLLLISIPALAIEVFKSDFNSTSTPNSDEAIQNIVNEGNYALLGVSPPNFLQTFTARSTFKLAQINVNYWPIADDYEIFCDFKFGTWDSENATTTELFVDRIINCADYGERYQRFDNENILLLTGHKYAFSLEPIELQSGEAIGLHTYQSQQPDAYTSELYYRSSTTTDWGIWSDPDKDNWYVVYGTKKK